MYLLPSEAFSSEMIVRALISGGWSLFSAYNGKNNNVKFTTNAAGA